MADFRGRFEGVFFNAPLTVVKLHEVPYGFADIIHSSEHPAVNGLLFQRSVKAFGNSVGLGFRNEGEAGNDSPELHLVQKMIREVLGAMIHSQG